MFVQTLGKGWRGVRRQRVMCGEENSEVLNAKKEGGVESQGTSVLHSTVLYIPHDPLTHQVLKTF